MIPVNAENNRPPRGVILLAPAGNFESLNAALHAGADAVYFGVGSLNMRSRAAANFREEELPRIVRLCHEAGAQAFLTLNTIVYDSEIPDVRRICANAKRAGADAVIAADPAVLAAVAEAGLPAHLSVQANVANLAAVRFYARYADVVVPVRELTLAQIERLCAGIREEAIRGPSGELVRLELFVHGALCTAVSGKCYMSLAVFNSSANRGDCYQPCRRSYTVHDTVTGQELAIDNHYVMSPRDLCTIDILDRILDAGVSVLKIEGRGRSADYVAAVTKVYREAVDVWRSGRHADTRERARWKTRLSEVFNRGFWHGGYYLGEKVGEWAASAENRATLVKTFAGKVTHYYPKMKIAAIRLTARSVRAGERFLITGPTTGVVEGVLDSLRVDDSAADAAEKGAEITFSVPETVRENDKCYILSERSGNETERSLNLPPSEEHRA